MDLVQVRKDIEKGRIAPLYVFFGKENYLIQETVKELTRSVLDEEEMDFQYEVFDLQEQPVQEAVEAAETISFMGGKKLVIASGATFLTSAKSKNQVEHHIPSLQHYADNPVHDTVFVLIVHEEKLDERKKVVKTLKKKGVVAAAKVGKEQQLQSWMQEEAKQYGVQLEAKAGYLLCQFVGENMRMLAKEIEKMAHYVGQGALITEQVVQEQIARSVEQDVFTLVDHVAHLRLGQAFQTLHELLKRNEEPIKILFLLVRQFRIIYRVKDLDQKGYTTKQMASILRLHPYVCKLALQQGKRFSNTRLLSILDQLAELDYRMKTGQMDKVLALEMFLLRLGEKQATS